MAEETVEKSTTDDLKDRDHDDRLKRDHFLKSNSDQIDLNLLLKAVLDISEKLDRDKEMGNGDFEKPSTSTQHETTSSKERTVEFDRRSLASASSSRPRSNYRYRGEGRAAPTERKNLSFSNNKVIDIDRENQRLLKKINTTTRARPKSAVASSKRAFAEPMRVQTPAEVNRTRFQKKVDEENQKILQRLQSIKPTQSLSKDYLSKEADSQKRYMVSKSRPSSAGSMIPRRSRMSHGTSESSLMTSDTASVASSRTSRTSSASRRSRKRRDVPKPVWEPGW